MNAPAYAPRLPSPPKVRVPVLCVPAALEAFAASMDEIVDGYVAADVYQNGRDFWTRLLALADRGVVWMPERRVAELHALNPKGA